MATYTHLAKARGLPPPVSVQNDYSLNDRRFETEMAEACATLAAEASVEVTRARARREKHAKRGMPMSLQNIL